ncbi:TRAP-type C4-dicarboxylate transport system permease small subunit [Lipingzhangella halophila]|uniref:TRAP-type C4-dicarboxylate transport system permease small subunit n=1 Tax=Lipingzhangella halophila TaxID=1783352 RepID=A0A7W7RDS8_9ACTN|nr:TRAP transporter small permease [Lipingzhangella halophila]MBB4929576.1 TRAP-type C4-dicarboxylate transport system permease small subunit [Lipingzhangella halophila]
MDRIARAIAAPLGILASISTIVMMLGISADVAYRNIAGESIAGVLELTESALVATVFFGLAYAGTSGTHIAVDLLTSRLPEKAARGLMLLAWVLGCVILGWLVYASFGQAVDSFERNELRMGLVSWPLWPARWFVVVGFAALLLVAMVNVARLLTGRPLMGDPNGEAGSGDAPTES